MNEKIAMLLNEQITKELYSAYLYLDISNYYDSMDLDGYANYYMIQAQEEQDHALLFMKYMQNNGLKVTLEAIDKPDKAFDSVLAPLEIAAEHERYVTALINNIYHEAHNAKDYRTMKFLDWFVDEQMEEEDNADTTTVIKAEEAQWLYDAAEEYLCDHMVAGRGLEVDHVQRLGNDVINLTGSYGCLEMIGEIRYEERYQINGKRSGKDY